MMGIASSRFWRGLLPVWCRALLCRLQKWVVPKVQAQRAALAAAGKGEGGVKDSSRSVRFRGYRSVEPFKRRDAVLRG